jgi:[ribosomal protein S5]-alanine N-acetyltransferase
MLQPFESERLLYRELLPSDAEAMFEMDSNPEVHRYLGGKPTQTIEETRKVIDFVRQQYIDNGIGRFAAVLKETGEWIGWVGLKLERNVNGHEAFYDIGYRLRPEFWGKGFATESAIAFVDYGFNVLKADKICAYADESNNASRRALEKAGLKYINTFDSDYLKNGSDERAVWYEIVNPHR